MESEYVEDASMIFHLLKDPYIIIATGSVWFSTSSMALLEPCLPLWLLKTIHPEVSLSKEYLMIHDTSLPILWQCIFKQTNNIFFFRNGNWGPSFYPTALAT